MYKFKKREREKKKKKKQENPTELQKAKLEAEVPKRNKGAGLWGRTRPVTQRGKGAESSPMPLGACWAPRVVGECVEPARPP